MVQKMRPEHQWAMALLGIAIVSLANCASATSQPPGEDERQVLLATSGLSKAASGKIHPPHDRLPPPELDGKALQRWFDEQFGRGTSQPLQQHSDVSDAEAEADFLRRIEQRRIR